MWRPSDVTKYLSETNQLKTLQRSFSWCLNETDFFETSYQRTSWYLWSLSLTTGICYLFDLLKIKMVHSIYSSCYLIWFDLVAVTGFLASNVFCKSLESGSILNKLQASENIRGGFTLLVTLNAAFCKIALLKLHE